MKARSWSCTVRHVGSSSAGSVCMAKGSKHHDHDYDELGDAIKKYRVEITTLIEPMEKQVSIIEKALEKLDARCKDISDQQITTVDNIHTTFRRLREVLNVREIELTGHLHEMTQENLKDLAAQRDRIETNLAQLCSCLHFMRESLRAGNYGEVLTMKTHTVKRVKELSTPFHPATLEPSTEADIKFSASADAISVCQNYGQVLAPGSPNPSQCYVTGKGAEEAVVGEKSTAFLQVVTLAGKPCKKPIKTLECGVVSDISGTRADCSVSTVGAGVWSQYEICYQPTIKGRHSLHIQVNGQHIRGSPFRITVKNFGAPDEVVGSIGGVVRPWGVAVNQKGEVVVTEMDRCCASVFSLGEAGVEKLRSFVGSGRFYGVAVDGEENVLLVDHVDNHIHKASSSR